MDQIGINAAAVVVVVLGIAAFGVGAWLLLWVVLSFLDWLSAWRHRRKSRRPW